MRVKIEGLRERPFDIYGGGGPEELAKKKFASNILSKKKFVSDQKLIKICAKNGDLKKKSLLLWNTGKKSLLCG